MVSLWARSGQVRSFRVAAGVVCVSMSCAVVATGVVSAAPAAPAAPASDPAAFRAGINRDIDSASAQLARAGKAVTAAKITLDGAAARLPAAEQQLGAAQARLGQAQVAVVQAQEALAAAKQDVIEQRQKIAVVLGQIEKLKIEIAALSREAYISGGSYQELTILLNAENPSDLALQLESVRRQARGNTSALDRMAAAKQALALKMIELKGLEETALAKQADADSRAQDAQAAADSAAVAKQEIATLVATRSAAVRAAQTNKAKLNQVVDALLAKQARIAAESARRERKAAREAARQARRKGGSAGSSGSSSSTGGGSSSGGGNSARVPWAGQSGAARVALRFALNQVGQAYASGGGTGPYAFDCVGLVWRAWHKAGSKWPLMQVEDEAHSRWVDLIPRSQVRPGDLIMWRLDNGTDGRPNALDHIGMVVDPDSGLFVQAESSRTGVRLSNWKEEGFYMSPDAFGRVVR